MDGAAHDPRGGQPEDDLSIVPGLAPTGRLDPAADPDRFDPNRSAPHVAGPTGRLDPAADPDRYVAAGPPGQGQSLTDLLGPGAQETSRDGYEWAFGLLAVLAFLALVAWVFGSLLSR